MKLTIIEPDNEYKLQITTSMKVFWGAFFIASIILGLYDYFYNEINAFVVAAIVILLCITFVFAFIISLDEHHLIDFIEVGTIEITKSNIIYNFITYSYQDIKSLSFSVRDFKGQNIGSEHGDIGGATLSKGVNNRLTIKTDKDEIVLVFRIDSEAHLNSLADTLKELYRQKIPIKEALGNSRSYGLQHLNYKQIQEFKKKYIN